MLRLMLKSQAIEDPKLAKTLLKGGVLGLSVGWMNDLGVKEERPMFLEGRLDLPLHHLESGMYDLFWEKDGSMDQLVLTEKNIFWGTGVFVRPSGIARVLAAHLGSLQVYLTGSGMRVMAFGSETDPTDRKYHPYRARELVRSMNGTQPLVGQVDLETGEVWPLPKDMIDG